MGHIAENEIVKDESSTSGSLCAFCHLHLPYSKRYKLNQYLLYLLLFPCRAECLSAERKRDDGDESRADRPPCGGERRDVDRDAGDGELCVQCQREQLIVNWIHLDVMNMWITYR